ncbi:hypothetical protein HZH66_006653 [Vespula vulgaris]|uniref:Uncharacterized protein n=1 Tax=Vespula vulgaris TaxID=7454 RepID=A0A834K3Y6_VESVU|nr:hypothetical protein HZH66_006653 [Vespula vulgaris]
MGEKGVSRWVEGGSREKRRRDAETPRRGCRAPSVLDSSGPMTAMFVGRNGNIYYGDDDDDIGDRMYLQ